MIDFAITILSLLIGYFLGAWKHPYEDTHEFTNFVSKKVKEVKYRNTPSGIIQRPSAERLYDLQHPEVLEEKEEMKKELQKGIEPLTP